MQCSRRTRGALLAFVVQEDIHRLASGCLESAAASPAATPSTTTPIASSWSSPTASTTPRIVLLPVLRFWCVVHEECVEGQSVGEDEVADVVPPDRQAVERCWVAIASSHLDGLEMGVHLHIHACKSVPLRNEYIGAPHSYDSVDAPVIVPCTMDPFLSSTVTVSLLSFIKNLVEKGDVSKLSRGHYQT